MLALMFLLCKSDVMCSTHARRHITFRLQNTSLKKARSTRAFFLAGETRFEHATSGFGDRCSTVEPLPYCFNNYTAYANIRQAKFNLF